MKKIVSALLVAGLLVILLVVGGTGRHRVINVQNEPEQITGEKEDKGSAGEADGKTNENGAETKENTEDTSTHLKIGVLLIGDETEIIPERILKELHRLPRQSESRGMRLNGRNESIIRMIVMMRSKNFWMTDVIC